MWLMSWLIGLGLLFVVEADTWETDKRANHLERNKRLHRKLGKNLPWEKAMMPYFIEENAMPMKHEYDKIIAMYEASTCVRMPYYNESSTAHTYGLSSNRHALFVKDKGCVTVGHRVSCCTNFECMHEIGHLLGFPHEQSDPNRVGWIRANWNDMWPSDRSTYRKDTSEWDMSHVHDITSPMHYKPWMYGVRTGSMSVLFPELSIHWEVFTYFGEVALVYRCATSPPCQGITLNCENGGYQTVLLGKCACQCPTGLDRDNACKTPLKQVTSASWPKGQYALPQPQTGCPNGGSFQDGKITQSGPEGNSKSNPSHLMGEIEGSHAELNFCTRTIADDLSFETEDAVKFNWPNGDFCIYKKGDWCPAGFTSSSIQYNMDSVTTTGQVPGRRTDNTNKMELNICCQYRNFAFEPIFFPTDKPFYLIKSGSSCQAVTGMRVESESFTIWSKDGFKTDNLQKWVGHDGKSLAVPLCHYHQADMDCGGSITLSKSNPEVTIEMRGNERTDLECTWVIRGDHEGSTLVLDFDDLNVKKDGKNCVDSVEVRHSEIGQFGLRYCGEKPDHSIRSITDKLLIRFFTKGNSESSFKAKIGLSEYADMCYDLEDKRGANYDGSVNYTRLFKPCLPWAEMSECYHHPYLNKDLFASLDGNACRNPDNSYRPWCYTDKNGCRRDYCDVCGIEVPHDRSNNCDKLKENGFCTTDASLAVQYCPKTCFDQLPSSKTSMKKYTQITCGQPTPPSDGTVVGETKSSYNLGDTVQFKCNRGASVIPSTCMTSGQWSYVGTACLECPIGSSHTDNLCYAMLEEGKKMRFEQASSMCKSKGGTIATPKSHKEAAVIASIAAPAWIGIKDEEVEGTWVYEDGTKLTWLNWEPAEPNNVGNEDCAVTEADTTWIDISCHNSYHAICQYPKLVSGLGCVDVMGDKCKGLLKDRPTLCDDKPDFVRQYCHKSCGLCSDDDTKCSVQNTNSNVLTKTTQQSISVGESVKYDCVRFTYPTKGDKHQACLPGGVLNGKPLQCEECPLGFKLVNNACHGLLPGKTLSFNNARKECEKIDGFVAMPKSQAENDIISSLAFGDLTWMGLTDRKNEHKFVWDDGSALGWTHWAKGDPKKSGYSQDCTMLNTFKDWVNVKCKNFKLATVCTLPKTGGSVCYDRTDKGATYNGKAHVTIKGHVCGNWADKEHCSSKSPFSKEMERHNLKGNYCRNPDNSARPWCYTDGCSWELCDVCDRGSQPDYDPRDKGKTYMGTAHVTVNGDMCGNWADKKGCHVNPVTYPGMNFDQNYCRNYDNSPGPWCYTTGCHWAVCDMSLTNPLVSTNIVDIKCSPPPIPSDGEMVNNPRTSYKLGEEVTFKCKRNKFLVTTTCLTSGDWTPVGLACTECPVGYYPFNDTCYGFMNKMLNYDMAFEECSKMDGYFARPKTLEENDFVKNMNHDKYLWLDAKRNEDGELKWSDGTDVNWLRGKRGKFDCSFMDKAGEWGTTACEFIQPGQMFICAVPKLENTECKDFLENQCTELLTEKPSMCQDHAEFAKQYCAKTCSVCGDGGVNCKVDRSNNMAKVSTEADTITVGQFVEYNCKGGLFQSIGGNNKRACLPNGQLTGSAIKCQSCPEGYVKHNNLCYGFIDKAFTFDGAAAECKKVNGYIASPKNGGDNDFIDSIRRKGVNVWIGGSDAKAEGDFRWQDGTKLEYQNWNAGEPSNYMGYEDCIEMLSNKEWNDVGCGASNRLVCTTPILGEEMCYNVEDKGATYDGQVSVTDTSQTCIPWATATKCPHNPFVKGDEQKNLVENYCRNPDNSPAPWCYMDSDTCDKKYCNVCENEQDADYTQVRCQAPTPPGDGKIQSDNVKDEYKVGEMVSIVCKWNVNTIPITTRCLASGQWSSVGLACTECPMGYELFNGQCYGFANKVLNFNDANKYCHDTVEGYIASPKSEAENDFVYSLRNGKNLWIGANDIKSEGTWVWVDGSKLTWNNWESGEPNNWAGNEDGAAMKSNKKWNDLNAGTREWFVCATPKKDLQKILCEDLIQDQCPLLLSKNTAMCNEHKNFASQFCAKTCKLCDPNMIYSCRIPSSDSVITVHSDESHIPIGGSVEFSCTDIATYPYKGDKVRTCLNTGQLSGTPIECQDVLKAKEVSIGPTELTNGNKQTPPFVAFFGVGAQYKVQHKGQIVAWEFYSDSSLKTALQVWRKTPKKNYFKLIGQNVITTGNNKGQERHDIPVGERINVEPGDDIGIVNAGKGGVRFFSCDKTSHPEWHDSFDWSNKVHALSDFHVGADSYFKAGTSCVLFPLRAILAVLD